MAPGELPSTGKIARAAGSLIGAFHLGFGERADPLRRADPLHPAEPPRQASLATEAPHLADARQLLSHQHVHDAQRAEAGANGNAG